MTFCSNHVLGDITVRSVAVLYFSFLNLTELTKDACLRDK